LSPVGAASLSKNRNRQGPPQTRSGWIAFAGIVEALLNRFGWPGLLLVYSMYFVQNNASLEQKRDIIDLYVLGKGIGQLYPLIVMGSLFTLTLFAQRFYYRKQVKLMDEELQRLGKWKTEYQEKQIGAPLHHSDQQIKDK